MRRKKKQNYGVVIVLICTALLVYFFFPAPVSLSALEKRAVWLTYQDLSNLSYQNKKAFQKDFQNILQTVKKYQCNTLIVHTIMFADALYPSQIYPLSQVITGQKALTFDPLEEMVKMAHDYQLKIEAWINPYRISLNRRTYQQYKDNSPYASWLDDSSHTIHYGDYQYIFNPANSNVRNLIVEGVKEIVKNYRVDGIHFDDYFYIPQTHGNTTKKQRQENVNMLIQDVYQSIKAINPDVTFGISPQGNYDNCIDDGADIDLWLKEEGFIDYLMPQIYWSDCYGKDGQTKLFSERVKQFINIKRHAHIKMYVGLALYQSGQELKYDQGWTRSSNNISRQVQILYDNGYDGYSLFHYSSLLEKNGQKEMNDLLSSHSYE